MEKKLRKEHKVIRLEDEAAIKAHLNDGYVIVEPKKVVVPAAPKTPVEKTFEQMNAGEQIKFVNGLTDLAAVEALVGKIEKKTAVAAIEAKVVELKLADVKAKALEAGVEVLENDTIETLEKKIADKTAGQ